MAEPDLAQTVLVLEAHNQDAISSFQDPHNKKFLLAEDPSATVIRESIQDEREGTPFVQPSSYCLSLRFDQKDELIDPSNGWSIGSDAARSDIKLGSQKLGVSKVHFRITHNWDTRTLLFKNKSKTNGNTQIQELNRPRRNIRPEGTLVIPPGRQISVFIGVLQLSLKIPWRDSYEKLYQCNLEDFGRDIGLRPPGLGRLQVRVDDGNTDLVAVGARSYILGQRLGSGAFGTVYMAKDRETGTVFAAKQFTCLEGESAISDVKREIQILQQIKHNNIIQFVNSNTQENAIPTLIMEFAAEGHLSQDLGFAEREIGKIFDQMLRALDYLHGNHQVTHRDIKPANILITSRDPVCAKLSDFGLSKKGQLLKTFAGSPLYCAPEVLLKGMASTIKKNVIVPYTQKVDIWSLGVVLLEFTCGLPSEIPQPNLLGEIEEWTRRLEAFAAKQQGSLVQYAKRMVRIQPIARLTAQEMIQLIREDRVNILQARGGYLAPRWANEGAELQREVKRLMTAAPDTLVQSDTVRPANVVQLDDDSPEPSGAQMDAAGPSSQPRPSGARRRGQDVFYQGPHKLPR
ncbi:putative calcium calmodulin-dependent protein kinase type iv [Phaeomoniella chlamydospora]|uniref:Serine/threonine-protein kinase ATG1 n=1 Tax=Phaeomoniella chlamydospora TaxID=158046 RepID=A0A0G2EW54_PHACM|nr:putative calcium calmodulin-dependent protein kinase type iv [Phaeomoniella chlamydospora]